MLARPLLAMIAMLLLSAKPCASAGLEVGVYLRSDGAASTPVLDAMKSELDMALKSAGFRLKWWPEGSPQAIEAEELIVVDLRGTCRIPQRIAPHVPAHPQLELASTSVVGKQILPFSSVDCSTFNSLLAGSVLRATSHQREHLYGRALGRVLAHEFYHVLAKTPKHTATGVAKRAHSANDLMADNFDFDSVALGQLLQRSARHPNVSAKNQTGSESALEALPEPAVSSTSDGRQ
jgi:hypothetical protein